MTHAPDEPSSAAERSEQRRGQARNCIQLIFVVSDLTALRRPIVHFPCPILQKKIVDSTIVYTCGCHVGAMSAPPTSLGDRGYYGEESSFLNTWCASGKRLQPVARCLRIENIALTRFPENLFIEEASFLFFSSAACIRIPPAQIHIDWVWQCWVRPDCCANEGNWTV